MERTIGRLTLAQAPADCLLRPKTGDIQTLNFAGGRDLIAAGEAVVYAAKTSLQKALNHVLHS